MPGIAEKLAYVVVLKLFPNAKPVERSELIFMEIYKLSRPTSTLNVDLGVRRRVFHFLS